MRIPVSADQHAHQRRLDELEQRWQAGSIPNPQGVAIILVNQRGQVLLQLRDNKSGLEFANHWTLPGGAVEAPELPEQAASRELAEEIGSSVRLVFWKMYQRWHHNRHFLIDQYVYVGHITPEAHQLILGEGQALGFFAAGDIAALPMAYGFEALLGEFFTADTPSQ